MVTAQENDAYTALMVGLASLAALSDGITRSGLHPSFPKIISGHMGGASVLNRRRHAGATGMDVANAARSANRSSRCRCAIYTRKSSDGGGGAVHSIKSGHCYQIALRPSSYRRQRRTDEQSDGPHPLR